MFILGDMASSGSPKGVRQISYVSERSDEGQKGPVRFLDFIQDSSGAEQFLDNCSLARETVTPKGNMEGMFHSSDLVAWEWSKRVERHRGGHRMRGSLAALIGENPEVNDGDGRGCTVGDGKKYLFRHLEDRALGRMVDAFRGTTEATRHEEVDAAFNRWAEGA